MRNIAVPLSLLRSVRAYVTVDRPHSVPMATATLSLTSHWQSGTLDSRDSVNESQSRTISQTHRLTVTLTKIKLN